MLKVCTVLLLKLKRIVYKSIVHKRWKYLKKRWKAKTKGGGEILTSNEHLVTSTSSVEVHEHLSNTRQV